MKEKILIIEDNENIQMMLKTILANADYESIVAKNGNAGANAVYNDEEIKAIICDIMMPGSDGFEFLEKTKNIRQENNIPVCMLTAIDDSKSIIKSIHAGANDYMVKPIDKEILLEKISLMLESGKQQTFSTCKANFPVRLHTFDTPVFVKALNEAAIIIEIKEVTIEPGDVFQLEHCMLNQLSGIPDLIVKATKITELDGSKAAKLDFIGLTEVQRGKLRSITIKGEEIIEQGPETQEDNNES